jgi:catechol 2,3-dioxygenase-like lactoylglutathione lyase family enzyme
MSSERPRVVLSQLNLVAEDMAATVAFYRRLGLEIPDASLQAAGGHHVEVPLPGADLGFDLDSPTLAKAYNGGFERAGGSRGGVVIGFSVAARADVDGIYADLTGAGHPGLQEPYDAFWGARYAIVADPDGNHVGVMSPIDETRRSAPPPLGGSARDTLSS